jgi:hypothetical protein
MYFDGLRYFFPQIAKVRPIWSHWLQDSTVQLSWNGVPARSDNLHFFRNSRSLISFHFREFSTFQKSANLGLKDWGARVSFLCEIIITTTFDVNTAFCWMLLCMCIYVYRFSFSCVWTRLITTAFAVNTALCLHNVATYVYRGIYKHIKVYLTYTLLVLSCLNCKKIL